MTRRPLPSSVALVAGFTALAILSLAENAPSDNPAYPIGYTSVYLPAVVRDHVRLVSADPVAELVARGRQVHTDDVASYGRNAGAGVDNWPVVTVDTAMGLEAAVRQSGGLVILLASDVKLSRPLAITSDKVLIGQLSGNSGQLPAITGHGLQLRGVSNVVISHVAIRGVAGDAIEVSKSHDVWLDRLSLSRAGDGLVDLVRGSGGVTLSGSHLFEHEKVMLIGSSDAHVGDKATRVSIIDNVFGPAVGFRLPAVRYGVVESVGNIRQDWSGTAVDVRMGGRVTSCGDTWQPSQHSGPRYVTNTGATWTECDQ